MKTLVINGSPKKNGDTQALLDAFLSRLQGEVKIVSMADNISPCVDCRSCRTKSGCPINDDMQAVYRYIEVCDNVVLASPVWFSSLSGPLLNIASRLQTLFMGRYSRGEKHEPTKNGVLILAGAQPKTFAAPAGSAQIILRNMDVKLPLAAEVFASDTDHIPAADDADALHKARMAARRLNELCGM